MTAPPLTLEALLTSPAGFGLATATPLQRAICRAADGLPLRELAERRDVREAFGDVYALPGERPAELTVISGIRTGKSLLAAAIALRASQTCDVSRLGPGEVPRVSIVSLTIDLGRVVFDHLVGTVRARPALRALMVGDPTTDALVLRHPSGRHVEVKVVAASRAGGSLVARWSAGCVFDEAPRMAGELDGLQVNLSDLRAAVLGRLLEGAQIVNVGSPWASDGPVYEQFSKRHGRPSKHLVVVRAPAPTMNPEHWTPARCAALEEQDARAYRRDVLAEFGSADDTAFDRALVLAAVDRGVAERPPIANGTHVAAFDASGGRRDAYALVIGHRELRSSADGPPRDVVVVDLVRRWAPGFWGLKTVDFDKTIDAVAALCKAYRATLVRDGYASDAIKSAFNIRGVRAVEVASMSPARQKERFSLLAQKLRAGDIRLVDDADLVKELCALRERLHPGGRVSYEAPRGGFDDLPDCAALLCEGVRDVAPCGGDIEMTIPTTFSFDMATGECHGLGAIFEQVLPNGERRRCSAPRGTPEWEVESADRRARGIYVVGLDDMPGEGAAPSLNVVIRH